MDRHLGFGSPSSTDRDGELVLLPHAIAHPDDTWFWSPESQAAEQEAEEDLAAGRYTTFENEEEFLAHLHPNDVWFWEEGQQQAEREADEELAAGEINAPMTGEEFLSHLEEVTGEKTSEEP